MNFPTMSNLAILEMIVWGGIRVFTIPTMACSILYLLLGIIAVCGIGRLSGLLKRATTANQSAKPPTIAASQKERRTPMANVSGRTNVIANPQVAIPRDKGAKYLIFISVTPFASSDGTS